MTLNRLVKINHPPHSIREGENFGQKAETSKSWRVETQARTFKPSTSHRKLAQPSNSYRKPLCTFVEQDEIQRPPAMIGSW